MARIPSVAVISNKFNIVTICSGKQYVHTYTIGEHNYLFIALVVSTILTETSDGFSDQNLGPFIEVTHLKNTC
jgi:hypothetical protein